MIFLSEKVKVQSKNPAIVITNFFVKRLISNCMKRVK